MKLVIRDIEVAVEYPKSLFSLRSDLLFLLERSKIKSFNKFFYSVRDKKNYVAHIKSLNQALYYGLVITNCTE